MKQNIVPSQFQKVRVLYNSSHNYNRLCKSWKPYSFVPEKNPDRM